MISFSSFWRFRDVNQETATQLLMTPTALADLTAADARVVAGLMVYRRISSGTVFIKEGEVTHTDFMMLILDGEVSVESELAAADGKLVMFILGSGSLIGEMGLLDGAPRSASCTARTDLAVAVITLDVLLKLIQRKPLIAARLLLAISKRMADRLREANRKIKTMGGLNRALQLELDSAHRANDTLSRTGVRPSPVRA